MEPACRPFRGALRPIALFAGWSAVRLLAGGLTWPPTLQAEGAGGVCAQPYTYYGLLGHTLSHGHMLLFPCWSLVPAVSRLASSAALQPTLPPRRLFVSSHSRSLGLQGAPARSCPPQQRRSG